jgi:hypothetical protein
LTCSQAEWKANRRINVVPFPDSTAIEDVKVFSRIKARTDACEFEDKVRKELAELPR